MGTRGFITFVADGQEKTAYNHWDSYPSGLGVKVLEFLREAVKQPAVLGAAVRALRVVSGDSTPSPQDTERLLEFADASVGNGSIDDWYTLLRKTQGEPAEMLRAGVIEDACEFPLDSLFAEYGYVIDIDGDGWFEAYRGFQQRKHDKGRFAARDSYVRKQESSPRYGDVYYPVALAARWPLTGLPGNDEFLGSLREPDEEG